MPRIGLIARMDRTGLGQGQTLRLTRLLQPEAIMLIDSSPFNGNPQYPEWYKNTAPHLHVIKGFPSDEQVQHFLEYCDIVISCETFYNNRFTILAKEANRKTILIANYEFFDWHRPQFGGMPLPDRIVMPSLWHIEEMQKYYGAEYIPTPIFEDEFAAVQQVNLKRTKYDQRRFLFINGKQAVHDRNGLLTVHESLKYTNADFEIVVKTQGDAPAIDDPRVKYEVSDVADNAELYRDFDALIMPRRYAGQCLPMTEALTAGLPVIMTDIDPNNRILPKEWLIPAKFMGTFMTRKPIELYSGDPKALASLLEHFTPDSQRAFDLSKLFGSDKIKADLERVISSL